MTENEIIERAINLPPSEQDAFACRACGDDVDLLQRVLSRLRSHPGRTEEGTLTALVGNGVKEREGELLGLEPTRSIDSHDVKKSPVLGSGELRRGDIIGPFHLLQPLGRGGMGEVWKAEQLHPVKRYVALKVIKSGFGSKEVLARFDAERQALARMNHPNIARIVDAGEAPDGQPYFAMELVEGQPLTKYCDDHELGIDERLELFRSVCMGVQHAHQKGIIHRDLKPGNILVAVVDGNPIAKVIDFGLAKAMESTARLTDQSLFTGIGQILGTLKYMSPEQAGLDMVDIDTRTDIYSLGVVLYELLTGTTPLEDSSIKELAALKILEFVREKEPLKPSSRLSSSSDDQLSRITGKRKTDNLRLKRVLEGDLDWVVMKAIEKDRARRYQSASGFADDVQRYLKCEPVDARPPSVNYRVKKFVRKNRIAVISASLVVLALLAGIVGTTIGLLRAVEAEKVAENSRSVAESRREDAERNLRFSKKGNEILGSVFTSLDPNAKYQTVGELRNALRDNLQAAVDQLEEGAIGSPLAVADMQLTLAKSLIPLRETVSAIKLLENVRETRVKLLGIQHADTLESMNVLAKSYLQGGRIDEALELHKNTWEMCRLHLGQGHSGTLNSMVDLASASLSVGKTEQGLALLEEARQLSEMQFGKQHKNTLVVVNNLATAYVDAGRSDKALLLYKEVWDARKSLLGPNHLDTLQSASNLAWVQIDVGEFETAAELFRQTLEQFTILLGADNPLTLRTLSGLAATYEETNMTEKAIPLYERAYELMKLKLGSTHPDTLASMNNLAGAYYGVGQMEKTIEVFNQALEIMKSKFGPQHPVTLTTMNNLALAYKDTGELEKALPLFEQSLQGIQAINFKSPTASNMLTSSILAFEVTQQYALADHWRTIWQDYLKSEFGDQSDEMAEELEAHGRAMHTRMEFEEAEKIFRRCLQIRITLAPHAWKTIQTQSLLGSALLMQNKLADAEPQLLAGFNGLEPLKSTIPPDATPGILGTLDLLIQLHTALGQEKEIEHYRQLRETHQ